MTHIELGEELEKSLDEYLIWHAALERKGEHAMQPITQIKVKLIGEDGNAFYILGKVAQAMRDAGYDMDFVNEFMSQATAGDYDHLLQVVMTYVTVE